MCDIDQDSMYEGTHYSIVPNTLYTQCMNKIMNESSHNPGINENIKLGE